VNGCGCEVVAGVAKIFWEADFCKPLGSGLVESKGNPLERGAPERPDKGATLELPKGVDVGVAGFAGMLERLTVGRGSCTSSQDMLKSPNPTPEPEGSPPPEVPTNLPFVRVSNSASNKSLSTAGIAAIISSIIRLLSWMAFGILGVLLDIDVEENWRSSLMAEEYWPF
jgi:hypothetical protein